MDKTRQHIYSNRLSRNFLQIQCHAPCVSRMFMHEQQYSVLSLVIQNRRLDLQTVRLFE